MVVVRARTWQNAGVEPQVQYVQAKDGTSIAYAVYGGGPGIPLVKLPTAVGSHLSHNLQMSWEVYGHEIETWSAGRTVVHFDARGSGLSDRNIDDYSLDAMISDIEAVVDHLKIARFGIRPQGSSTMQALAYAARRPDRVAYIAALGGTPTGRLQWGSPRLQVALAAARLDWDSFLHLYPRLNIWGWDDRRPSGVPADGRTVGDDVAEYTAYMQASLWQADFLRRIDAEIEYDVTPLLPSIRTPVVVVVAGDQLAVSRDTRESSRVLATRLPDARLQRLPSFGGSRGWWVSIFDEFDRQAAHGAAPTPVSAPPPEPPPGIRSILFTDLEAHTSMMSRLGDAAGRDVLREHERPHRRGPAGARRHGSEGHGRWFHGLVSFGHGRAGVCLRTAACVRGTRHDGRGAAERPHRHQRRRAGGGG